MPAHYLALTYSTVWLLDSNILLYTDIRKKQIYSIQVKWNNFRLIGCINCFSCMVPVWQYCIYSQRSKVDPTWSSSATFCNMHTYMLCILTSQNLSTVCSISCLHPYVQRRWYLTVSQLQSPATWRLACPQTSCWISTILYIDIYGKWKALHSNDMWQH